MKNRQLKRLVLGGNDICLYKRYDMNVDLSATFLAISQLSHGSIQSLE